MNYSDFLPDYGDVLLPYEVQKILHVGRNTLYGYLRNQELKSLMIGGKYKIPKYYLYQFMFSMTPAVEGACQNGQA